MMKIYALRDRLLNYYHQPFFTPGDKEALVAVSNTINNGDPNSAVAKTPHHFEVFRLGEIDEEGNIQAGKEFLADASSLVRDNLREGGRGPASPGAGTGQKPPTSR